jgi:N-acetylglucosaminyldiphosphoundecaprenol N-acetyl-beta-D-mannosaminyltransferase
MSEIVIEDMKPIELFGTKMHALTMRETVKWIDERIAGRRFTQHVVVNVAKLVHMQHDATLRASVEECDIVNIDGMGVVWGARLLGRPVAERVAGVDLFHALVRLAAERGYPIFLLGAEDRVVREVHDRLMAEHPALRIAGFHHGYFWDREEEVVQQIAASGARLLFVAITSPKKENFINRWRDGLGVDFVMGVGGTFDVVAGKVTRAPHWMQRAGLEWFYRVLQEPRRMWKRYLTTNSKYVAMLAGELVRSALARRQ